MRFIKPIIILVILALIALFLWENMPTFNAQQAFQLSIPFAQTMKWTFSLASLVGISGVIGLLIGILIMFKPYKALRKKLVQERQGTPTRAPDAGNSNGPDVG